jgi:hypothetical protein
MALRFVKSKVRITRSEKQMQPSIRQLRAFVLLVEESNFTRAAKAMHLSQPAFSALIGGLETALGVRLFDRSKRHVALAPEGVVGSCPAWLRSDETTLDVRDPVTRRGFLSGYFSGAAVKRLSTVEITATVSNQHAFNGTVALRRLLGIRRQNRRGQIVPSSMTRRIDDQILAARDRRGAWGWPRELEGRGRRAPVARLFHRHRRALQQRVRGEPARERRMLRKQRDGAPEEAVTFANRRQRLVRYGEWGRSRHR